MKCPLCKEEITEVYVISEATQKGHLSGNKITSYEEIDNAYGATLKIDCSECGEDITRYVEEV